MDRKSAVKVLRHLADEIDKGRKISGVVSLIYYSPKTSGYRNKVDMKFGRFSDDVHLQTEHRID